MGASSENQSGEWTVLYTALKSVCSKYGVENPYGDGDYWIVDDDWGGVSQKIVVFSPKFLTRKLVAEISRCIRDAGLLGAQVIVAIDFVGVPPMGLIVDSDGGLEEWDIFLIRSIVGEDFYR